MNYLIYALVLLALSNMTFVYLYLKIKSKKSKSRKDSVELTEFMSDLLSGEAVVKVSRVNPHDVFLRSPRGRD